jgi:hypothetical protein
MFEGVLVDENTKIVLLALVGVISNLGSAWIGYLVAKSRLNRRK